MNLDFGAQMKMMASNIAGGGALDGSSASSDILSQFQTSEMGQTVKSMVDASGANPQEVMQDFGAMMALKQGAAEGKDPRQMLFDALKNSDTALGAKQVQLVKDMAQDNPMSKSQITAMMLIGIMPALIGGIVKGKTGLGVGAEAGAVGTQAMAKGLEEENKFQRALKALEVKSNQEQLQSNAETRNKALLDQANNAEKSATDLQVANIRAGGDKAIASALGKQLDNQKKMLDIAEKEQEAGSSNKALSLGDADPDIDPKTNKGPSLFANTGKVDKDTAQKVTEIAGYYETAINNLRQILVKDQNAQAPALGRVMGNSSKQIQDLYKSAQNAMRAAKDVKGVRAEGIVRDLDSIIEDPTSVWANIKGAVIPEVSGTIDGKILAAIKTLSSDYKNLLRTQGYSEVMAGKPIVVNRDGKKVPARIKGITGDGQFDLEPITVELYNRLIGQDD